MDRAFTETRLTMIDIAHEITVDTDYPEGARLIRCGCGWGIAGIADAVSAAWDEHHTATHDLAKESTR